MRTVKRSRRRVDPTLFRRRFDPRVVCRGPRASPPYDNDRNCIFQLQSRRGEWNWDLEKLELTVNRKLLGCRCGRACALKVVYWKVHGSDCDALCWSGPLCNALLTPVYLNAGQFLIFFRHVTCRTLELRSHEHVSLSTQLFTNNVSFSCSISR